MAKKIEYGERLGEIADTKIGELSDDQVLRLLAERKQLQALQVQYEQVQEEQVQLEAAETEKKNIEQELVHLNTLISPDKPDDELLHLVEERKVLEAKLETVMKTVATFKKGKQSAVEVQVPVAAKEEVVSASPVPVLEKVEVPEKQPEAVLDGSVEDAFGRERVSKGGVGVGSGLAIYLDQIRNDISSIGRVLDELPAEAKKNKAFMLEVAQIDPAYAMHYADKGVLKTNEDFNLAVVSLKNTRQSGSVLAEMLPEARTGKVVMAAVKQDYRNVRFALPQMEEYDEIIEKAKKSALDKVKEMRNSVDALTLVPKILQKDAVFMKKVEIAAATA